MLFLSQPVQVQLQLSETAAVRTIPGNKSAQKLFTEMSWKRQAAKCTQNECTVNSLTG